MGGSRMFVEAGTTVPVEALIHGIIVQSGNDACVVVAEGLAGSEAAFAEQMTRRAHELGMTELDLQQRLRLARGRPRDERRATSSPCRGTSSTTSREYYPYFNETEFTWNGITQPNRNPLLKLGIGVDGLKTGHTAEAGYGLVGSAVQNGQRIVFMVGGLDSERRARRAETEAIVKWAFGAFDTVKFFDAGARGRPGRRLARRGADGAARRAERPADAGAARGARRAEGARRLRRPDRGADRRGPEARRAARSTCPATDPVDFDLVAGADVPRGGLMTRISAAARLTRDRGARLPARRD